MDVKTEESFNPIEQFLIKVVNDFAHSFRLLNKSDSQVRLWLDTLNSVVTNILDMYKICFLTKNNMFCCQNVVDSLDGLKKCIKSITHKDSYENIGVNDAEKCSLYNTHDDCGCKINFDIPLGKNISSDVASQNAFTFGDVDYDLIMNNLKEDITCEHHDPSKIIEDNTNKKSFFNSSVQTDLTTSNCSFRKRVHVCSIGIQVDTIKHSNYSQNNFSSDYNLNDPYLCNQNYDELYQNLHYYNDSCSYQNDIDRNYQEHVSNFSHQYQPLPCASMSLPGRNISAPVFLPRLIASPTPVQHSSDHHHSSLPYTITMFSSSQSYIPGTFNSSHGPPQHYLGVSSHVHKESKRSHRKSEVSLMKKHKSSLSKTKDLGKNSQKKDKYLMPGDTSSVSYSCDRTLGYLAKIDLLEKACNFDSASYRCCFSKINLTSSFNDKSASAESGDSGFDKESYYNIISDFQTLDGRISNVSNLKILDDKKEFSNPEPIHEEVHIVNLNKDSNYYDKNISFNQTQKNTVSPLLNVCESTKMECYESQSNSGSLLTEPLDVVPVLENHNNNIDDTLNVTKKMDVKLSFVNVLTAGLKVSSDSQVCSVKKAVIVDETNETEINKVQCIKPPNVFELSHFPSLKPSSQPPLKNSEQVLYFSQCKPPLPCVFGVLEKSEKENVIVFGNSSTNQSSVSKSDNKSIIGKPKESEPSKKNTLGLANRGFSIKKNMPLYDYRRSDSRSPKSAYHLIKNSNVSSQSRCVKEDNSFNAATMDKKIEGSFNSINKKSKSDEIFPPKKSSVNKRKSVPGEDGWTVIPIKFRNPDPWNSKDLVNKKIDDLSLLSSASMSNDTEINNSEINCKTITDAKEESYPLSCQQHFFSSIQLDCSSAFFENSNSVIDDFDICHDLNVSEANSFSLPAIGVIEAVGESVNIQNSSPEQSSEQFNSSNYHMPSTSKIKLNTKDCSEGSVTDISSTDFQNINHFLDNSNLKNDSSLNNDLDVLSGESSNNNISLHDNNKVLSSEMNILDDIKLNKWPNYEECDIANFLSHSSCWSDLFKPDTDSEYQHLNEEDVRKSRELQEEAQMLRKKIKDLQLNENEVDTENEGDYENENPENIDPHEIFAEYSHYLSQISSWGDQIDEMERFQEMLSSDPDDSIFKFQYGSIEQFREFVARHPGKALDLHYKLLGRSKRSNSDELYEIRRKKAEEKRQRLLNRKAAKMRELLQRVEEVKQAQLQIIEERKCRIDFKLKKAEENRNLHLKTIQKKAHDEEEKLKEIAFINELEAQNRRHDSLALRQEQEERLQNIMEERQRKADEKAAKEAAVGERKRVLEAERMEKIEKIQQKRREKEEHIGKKQQERELERLVTAREKAREREERLQAIQAAQIANVEELQKKIKKKQENMARRHEENIQHIRQKAVETGMLRNLLPEDSNSDVSSKNNSTFDKKKTPHHSVYDIEEPASTKYQRKKCKKIRSRLQKIGAQVLSQLNQTKNKDGSRLQTILKSSVDSLKKLYTNNELSLESGLVKLEKQLSKLLNIVIINMPESKSVFKCSLGFNEIQRILVHLISPEILSMATSCKCIDIILEILTKVCENEISNVEYFISCGCTCDFLDSVTLLFSDLLSSIRETNQSVVQISALLLSFQDTILRSCFPTLNSNCASKRSDISKGLLLHLKDFVSYLLYCGHLKKIGDVIKLASLEPIECRVNEKLIESIVSLITCLIHPQYFWKDFEELLLSTDFMGTVSLLYGHLHRSQQTFPTFTLNIIHFFKALASEQLLLFQNVLGSDGFSLQFRYIAGFILQHCVVSTNSPHLVELLNQTILVIGYFALKNPENQSILQSGQAPTVLQQLISLPIQYFCEPKLKCLLFPTLIAICEDNIMCRECLENEMSYNHIESFLEDPISETAELMIVLKKYDNT